MKMRAVIHKLQHFEVFEKQPIYTLQSFKISLFGGILPPNLF